MPTELAVGFDDMTVLDEAGIEVFILNMDDYEDVPPFYIDVVGRRFSYSSITFPSKVRSATLPSFIHVQEGEGHLVILVERKGRYMAYVHDPQALAEEDDETEE